MKDLFNREINYLRISVTENCNLRCQYCVPERGISPVLTDEVLSFEEIIIICEQAVKLGIKRFKITGGEPLLRKDVSKLVGMIKNINGVEQVTMTSNGIMLSQYLDELIANGLDSVNISIDTLNPVRYHEITRNGKLEDALKGLDAAIKSGIRVKVNSVLYPGDDWKQMIELAKENPVAVRFIETMPIGFGEKYAGACKEDISGYFENIGITLNAVDEIKGNGPAVYYKPDGYTGFIGIIAPIHGKFCDSCNRIRLSSTGLIKPCLCYSETFDIKKCVRFGDKADVYNILKQAILAKPDAHRFSDRNLITEKQCMARIGG